MSGATHELLVYESEPRNAAMLARLGDVKLREVRSLMQLKRAMESQTADIVGVEVTQLENLPAVTNLVRAMKREARHLAVIAMPRRFDTDFAVNQWLYEAGADLIFASILDRKAARRLMQRALMRRPTTTTVDEPPFRSQVMARLPWKRSAT